MLNLQLGIRWSVNKVNAEVGVEGGVCCAAFWLEGLGWGGALLPCHPTRPFNLPPFSPA
jgi:hypothetical protein